MTTLKEGKKPINKTQKLHFDKTLKEEG
jgi:hypothetical protein